MDNRDSYAFLGALLGGIIVGIMLLGVALYNEKHHDINQTVQ